MCELIYLHCFQQISKETGQTYISFLHIPILISSSSIGSKNRTPRGNKSPKKRTQPKYRPSAPNAPPMSNKISKMKNGGMLESKNKSFFYGKYLTD